MVLPAARSHNLGTIELVLRDSESENDARCLPHGGIHATGDHLRIRVLTLDIGDSGGVT